MAIALSLLDVDNSGKSTYITMLMTFSGSYSTGGDTFDLTTIMGKQYLGRIAIAAKPPLYGSAFGSGGYSFGVIPGAALNNGKIKISTTAATELAAGAYPAGITGDANIYCTVVFDQNL